MSVVEYLQFDENIEIKREPSVELELILPDSNEETTTQESTKIRTKTKSSNEFSSDENPSETFVSRHPEHSRYEVTKAKAKRKPRRAQIADQEYRERHEKLIRSLISPLLNKKDLIKKIVEKEETVTVALPIYAEILDHDLKNERLSSDELEPLPITPEEMPTIKQGKGRPRKIIGEIPIKRGRGRARKGSPKKPLSKRVILWRQKQALMTSEERHLENIIKSAKAKERFEELKKHFKKRILRKRIIKLEETVHTEILDHGVKIELESQATTSNAMPPIKRGRGRPRKIVTEIPIKRCRGRPRNSFEQ